MHQIDIIFGEQGALETASWNLRQRFFAGTLSGEIPELIFSLGHISEI